MIWLDAALSKTMTLTMRLRLTDEPLEYDVLGLPPGPAAQIHNFMGDQEWRVLHIQGGLMLGWEGHYDSADEALAAIERQVRAERLGP